MRLLCGPGLSAELRSVLVMMLEPDPKLRATAEALLALPMLRQPRPWSVLWCMASEALSQGWALWQVNPTVLGCPTCSLFQGLPGLLRLPVELPM
jgi:membrane-associated tyrosine/threonine-specific cdc2-inhibitory kinase